MTAPIRIPRELAPIYPKQNVTLLLAKGVPEPDSRGQTYLSGACLFYADGRTGKYPCSSNIHRPDEKTRAALAARRALENLDKYPAQSFEQCRKTAIPAGSHVVALTTYAGVDEQDPSRLGVMGCLTDNYYRNAAGAAGWQKLRETGEGRLRCPEGRIDVEVRRPGRVFLLLQSERPARWNIKAAPGTTVTGAINISQMSHAVTGLPPDARFEQLELFEFKQPPCNMLWPVGAYYGGPNAKLLDRSFNALTGGHIGTYIRKPYAGTLSEPLINRDDLPAYSRFVVE